MQERDLLAVRPEIGPCGSVFSKLSMSLLCAHRAKLPANGDQQIDGTIAAAGGFVKMRSRPNPD
jgi:hypothetical protein